MNIFIHIFVTSINWQDNRISDFGQSILLFGCQNAKVRAARVHRLG